MFLLRGAFFSFIASLSVGQDNWPYSIGFDKGLDHCSLSDNYFKFIYWFSERSTYIEYTEIKEDNVAFSEFSNNMIQNLMSKLKSLVTCFVVNVSNEDELNITNITTELKDMEDIRQNEDNIREIFNKPQLKKTIWTRHVEPKLGVIVFVRSLVSLKRYLIGKPSHPFLKQSANFVIAVSTTNNEKDRLLAGYILQMLWRYYKIQHATIINSCVKPEVVGVYDPFESGSQLTETLQSQNDWGAMVWTQLNDFDVNDDWLLSNKVNFNGYPIISSVFRRFPTFVLQDELPSVFMNSYIAKTLRSHGNGYAGYDAMLMANIAEVTNFRPVPYISESYGLIFDNNTSSGSLGDVLNEVVDISFSSRFIEIYGSDSIAFILPVFADKICFIVPSAAKIPEWSAILRSFDYEVWISMGLINVLCFFIWLWILHVNRKIRNAPRRIDNVKVALDLFYMFTATSTKLPHLSSERWLIGSCLMATVIVTGTFQGRMYNAFSKTDYEKEIDTLRALDASGLKIRTAAPTIPNLFGTDNGTIINSLRSKYRVVENSSYSAYAHASEERNVAGIDRLTDASPIITNFYTDAHGHRKVHLSAQCIRAYHMAFIVKAGSPYLSPLNRILTRFYEAGLYLLWYRFNMAALTPRSSQMQANNAEDEAVGFNLQDLQIAFFILGIGLTVSTLTFCIEHLLAKTLHVKRTKILEHGLK